MIKSWKNKAVTVMGLGRFGGGVGVARWLAAAGAKLTITDLAPAEKLQRSLEQIADLGATLHLGGHDERDFRGADVIVINPAVTMAPTRIAASPTETAARRPKRVPPVGAIRTRATRTPPAEASSRPAALSGRSIQAPHKTDSARR